MASRTPHSLRLVSLLLPLLGIGSITSACGRLDEEVRTDLRSPTQGHASSDDATSADPDTAPPVVEYCGLAALNNAPVGEAGAPIKAGTYKLLMSAKDDTQLDSLGFMVDGALLATTKLGGPRLEMLVTLEEGSLTLTCVATDQSGQAGSASLKASVAR